MRYTLNDGTQPVSDDTLVDCLCADGGRVIGVRAGLLAWGSVQFYRIVYWREHEQE